MKQNITIAVFVVILVIFIGMYTKLKSYQVDVLELSNQLSNTEIQLELLNKATLQTQQEIIENAEKQERLEEIKKDGYESTESTYIEYSSVVVPSTTRVLLKQARDSANNTTNN